MYTELSLLYKKKKLSIFISSEFLLDRHVFGTLSPHVFTVYNKNMCFSKDLEVFENGGNLRLGALSPGLGRSRRPAPIFFYFFFYKIYDEPRIKL